jgi:hypothetical protein
VSLAFLSRPGSHGRAARRRAEQEVDSLSGRWRAACVGTGCCQLINTVTGRDRSLSGDSDDVMSSVTLSGSKDFGRLPRPPDRLRRDDLY